MAGHRARVNLFGGVPLGNSIMIDPNMIHYREMAIIGSHGSTPRQHKMVLDLIGSGKIYIKEYISHSYPLENIKEAFVVTEKRNGLRVIIKPYGIG